MNLQISQFNIKIPLHLVHNDRSEYKLISMTSRYLLTQVSQNPVQISGKLYRDPVWHSLDKWLSGHAFFSSAYNRVCSDASGKVISNGEIVMGRAICREKDAGKFMIFQTMIRSVIRPKTRTTRCCGGPTSSWPDLWKVTVTNQCDGE